MKVIIAGSRQETDADFVQQGIAAGLASWGLDAAEGAERQPLEVITGGARGVDTLAHDWAVQAGFPTHVFQAEWKMYGRAAGVVRNNLMAGYAQPDGALIAIHRDVHNSKGTKSMIKIALHVGLRVFVYDGAQVTV